MKKLMIYPVLVLVLGACNNNEAEKEAEIERARTAAIDSVNDIHIRARLDDSMRSLSDATIIPAPLPPDGPVATDNKPVRKTGTKKDKPVPASEPKNNDNTNTAGTPTTATPPTAPGGTVSGDGGKGDETASNEPGKENAPAEEKKKKGINNTVKGAIIGAGAGAVGGAIINKKNPGKGAIIGGVVGAGAGAVTGVILDKNKKKKEAKDTTGTKTSTKEPDSPKP